MESKEKLIIIGSGPAGLAAAIYAARGNLDPLVITGNMLGGHPTISTAVDDYPGFPEGIEGGELAHLFQKQAERFGTRFFPGEVIDVDLTKKPFIVKVENKIIPTDSLIIAVGSAPNWLGLPSEKKLVGKGVSVCATCDGPFFKGKKIAVVGGGDAAMKEAYYLSKIAESVVIIHRRAELRAQEALQVMVRSRPNIKFLFNSEVVEILGEEKVTGIKIKNNLEGKISTKEIEGVFVAIGHTPATGFLKGKIELDERGYAVIHEETKTSVEGVFAAGDAADPRYRQIVTSTGSGAKAALDVEEYLDRIHR